jgi:hypothetical protein
MKKEKKRMRGRERRKSEKGEKQCEGEKERREASGESRKLKKEKHAPLVTQQSLLSLD